MITPMHEIIKKLPHSSGVYFFKNSAGTVIYIGKAKAIQERVKSYFVQQHHDWKIKALLSELSSIDWVHTATEEEALLLEAELISTHKPKFNVLLKSGQPFLYILFTKDPIPKVLLVRNKKQKGTYFGPFLKKIQARGAYAYLLKTFKLEWCKATIPGGCLRSHLGLCAGNCMPTFDIQDYLFRVQLAQKLLEGAFDASLKNIQAKIAEYTQNLAFEKAKLLHEYAQNLHTIFTTLKTKFSVDKYIDETVVATAPPLPAKQKDPTLALAVQDFLKTEQPIHIIDCFDISHFQGKHIVGAVIRFVDGVPDKNSFRRFKIRSLENQNDYAALQEIVMRRYHDETLLSPDLVIVDGGVGQKNAVKAIIPDLLVVGLAKREERVVIDSAAQSIPLDIHTPVGKLFIAIRDYTHHFAISYHRYKRKKSF